MELLLGKPVVSKIKEELINRINSKKRKPCLVILLNKLDSSSIGYAHTIEKLGNELNLNIVIKEIETLDEYKENIEYINNSPEIDACLITRPLPKNLNEQEIISLLNYNKDVDSLSYIRLGQILVGNEAFVPNTALAIIKMLEYYKIDLEGKKVLVIGRSLSVGKPISMLLTNRNATVTLAHSKTKNLNLELINYDIIIGALGKPHFIDADNMKEGAIAIDAGIHYLEKGIIGDIKPSEKLSSISKVPGGIGPITTICLLENLVTCYEENTHDY